MNKLTENWVAALRSGKYKKGTLSLRNMDNEYCCLGVLCEVAGIPATLNARNEIYSYDGALITLPHQLKLRSIVEQCNLVEMNDSGDYTFDEIADYIETKGIEAVANATI